MTLLHAMNAEWAAFATDPDACDRAAIWAGELGSPLPHLTDILALITREPDRVLAFLIARAQDGDTYAGRAVVQAFLGKFVQMSNAPVAVQYGVSLDDLVGQAWLEIATYPLTNRPKSIAANLALDTFKHTCATWVTPHRHENLRADLAPNEVVGMLEDRLISFERGVARETVDELLDNAHQQGLITTSTWTTLTAVYRHQMRQADVAAATGISHAAVRQRCATAVTRLRTHVGELIPAA